MTDPKRDRVWSPAYEDDKKNGTVKEQPLLNKDVSQGVADQAADAIKHVMASVKPPASVKTVSGAS